MLLKKLKKGLLFTLVFCMLFQVCILSGMKVYADEGNAYSCSEWAKAEVDEAMKLGLIPESIESTDYTNSITRRDFCAISLRLYEKLKKKKASLPSSNPFEDTEDEEVLKAYNIGITNGTSDTAFSPNRLISREQMATMITRALGVYGIDVEVNSENRGKGFDDETIISYWALAPVLFLDLHDIMKGVGGGLFNPRANATIEQAILVSLRAYNAFKK